jgi:cytochrome d ubiquinol oxidase subunit I
MLLIPDEANERNTVELLGIPKFLSWLALGSWDAEFRGLKSWPKTDRPPVNLTFWAFRLMVGLGFFFALVSIVAWLRRNKLEQTTWLLRILPFMIPLPYLAAELGWAVTEIGRQPWIVYGVVRTAKAASPIASPQVAISLAAFIVVYSILGAFCFYLIAKYAGKGPERATEAGN